MTMEVILQLLLQCPVPPPPKKKVLGLHPDSSTS